ncbi:hypothetical protein [Absidia glauca]|uniref:Uncharacterized protein n=1 Tax=Absidia glauca TaxID=4829 RepID=A0A168PS58_ABSGL|nr:hypothetical protein [Absidia glauca]
MPPMNDGFYNGYNQPQYGLPPPPVAYDSPTSSSGYPRSFGHTQSPYYTMNPMHDAHQNGFQSRTEVNAHYGSPGVLHKPDEIHLFNAPNKPHSP